MMKTRWWLTLALIAGLVGPGGEPVRAQAEALQQHGEPAKEAPPAPGVVNLNTATMEELMRLPGVGPRKAEAIVARREKKKFARPEEIMEVKGIRRGIFKRCKAYLRVQGTTTLASKVVASRR